MGTTNPKTEGTGEIYTPQSSLVRRLTSYTHSDGLQSPTFYRALFL